MKHRLSSIASRLVCRRRRDLLGTNGSVAVELGLLGGLFLVPLVLGIIQYGIFFNSTQALAAATRVGAAYARDSATCRSGINYIVNPPTVSAACSTGIQTAIQNSMNFSPALPAPTITFTCECDDATAIACGNSCAAQNPARPAPNRVFVHIAQTQTFTPFITLWTVPTTINGVTDIRICCGG